MVSVSSQYLIFVFFFTYHVLSLSNVLRIFSYVLTYFWNVLRIVSSVICILVNDSDNSWFNTPNNALKNIFTCVIVFTGLSVSRTISLSAVHCRISKHVFFSLQKRLFQCSLLKIFYYFLYRIGYLRNKVPPINRSVLRSESVKSVVCVSYSYTLFRIVKTNTGLVTLCYDVASTCYNTDCGCWPLMLS